MNEKKIDILDVFKLLKRNIKLMLAIIVFITISGIIYSINKPNIYEVDSILEIGYFNNINNQRVLLENPNVLVNRLKFEYDVDGKEKRKRLPYVNDIYNLKQTKNIITISVLGLSKESAKKLVEKLNEKIITNHLKIIDEYKKNIIYSIHSYQKELSLLQNKIQENLKNMTFQKQKAQELANKNPSLGVVYLIEVLKENNTINKLENRIFELSNLINQEKLKLLPINIKQTKVIKVIVYQNKVKPKRSIIVLSSFIISIILALFLVFLIEFIKKIKEEK